MITPEPGEPFLLEVQESGFDAKPDGCVGVSGRRVRGTAQPGDALELVGFSPQPKAVELVANWPKEGSPTYIVRGVTKREVWAGQVLATPGTAHLATMFEAEVFFDERYEKITQQPLGGICRYLFYIHFGSVFGTLYLPTGKTHIAHGDQFVAIIELTVPIALEVGLHFGIGRLLGQGAVTEVIG